MSQDSQAPRAPEGATARRNTSRSKTRNTTPAADAAPPDKTWRAAGAGDGSALQDILQRALRSDAASESGASLRRLTGSLLTEQARGLVAQSASLPSEAAEHCRAQAREHLYQAMLVEHVRLVPAAQAPAAAQAPCLLDPPPDAPDHLVATATLLGAKLRWEAPNDNGKPIQRYEVEILPKPLVAISSTAQGAVTETEITGLVPGTAYRFRLRAINADGPGPLSAESNTVTIAAPPPAAPTRVTVKAEGALARVDWRAPAASPSPVSAYWVWAYDATTSKVVTGPRKLPGTALTTSFAGLAAGKYLFGVRAFNKGGQGPEGRSASAFDHVPAPEDLLAPILAKKAADPLQLFDLGAAGELLKPDLLRNRLEPALEKANKWRYEHLKGLSIAAATQTIGYEQYLASIMQMTLGKLSVAQLLANPVLNTVISAATDNAALIDSLKNSEALMGIVGRVGDAIGTVMGLEALVAFLLDERPLDFWVGLFDGLIRDIARFDINISRTDAFLRDYFTNRSAGLRILAAIEALRGQIDQKIEDVFKPVEEAVAVLVEGTRQALNLVTSSIDEALVAIPAVPGIGATGGALDSINDLIGKVLQKITELRNLVNGLLQGLLTAPIELVIKLIKIFIVIPILGILVIGLAGGPLGALALALIVVVAGIELIRLIARWLTGPINGLLSDARAKVIATIGELQELLAGALKLLQVPDLNLKLVAEHLASLRGLLPREFLNDVGQLVGEARRVLLSQGTELALAAERALGLENATAFDVIRGNYDNGVRPAPRMPGGNDPGLLGGLSLLRDLQNLERLRTEVLDPKEVVVTLRLSLFRLLGGVGNPVGAVGTAAQELTQLLGGGQLLLKLTESALIEQSYPGLYRAQVTAIKPVGLLAAASPVLSALPLGIPLSITHLGASRMRVKRGANPYAPPATVPEALRLTHEELLARLSADAAGQASPLLRQLASDLQLAFQEFAGTGGSPANNVPFVSDYLRRELVARLAPLTEPLISTTDLSRIVDQWVRNMQTASGNYGSSNLNIRKFLVNTLVTYGADLRARLSPALLAPRQRVLEKLQPKVAKWAGARFEEDRDPNVAALGFVTLIQDLPQETAVFNLLPELGGGGAGGILGGTPGGVQQTVQALGPGSLDPAQYRPFENRGIEGDWLLSMQSALTPGTLVDMLLEVTVRGCYDERLAAAVKSGQAQTTSVLDRAKQVAAGANKALVVPGGLPLLAGGASDLRTLHFSLRNHRDTVLKHALAALETLPATASVVDGLALDRNALPAPLKTLEPLLPITPQGLSKVTLSFQQTATDALGTLQGLIPVTPDLLGITKGLALDPSGSIVSIGMAVIPSERVTQPPQGMVPPPEKDFGLRGVSLDPLLASLLPQLDASRKDLVPAPPAGQAPVAANNFDLHRSQALLMTLAPPETPVRLSELFARQEAPALTLDFGDLLNNGWVHDVILSLSVRIPVPTLSVAPSPL